MRLETRERVQTNKEEEEEEERGLIKDLKRQAPARVSSPQVDLNPLWQTIYLCS